MKGGVMKLRAIYLAAIVLVLFAGAAHAQDLGAGFTKVKDGIYVFAAKEGNSNCSVVLTEDGPVVIDTCQTPLDAQKLAAGVKKLTDKHIRFVIDTEVHSDHTFGHYFFSPPAVVINHQGGGEGMRKNTDPKRLDTLKAQSPEMAAAVKDYKFIPPHIEYQNRMTLNLGERTFEMIYLKNVHSEADEAIWLPKERVLFAASAANVKTIINLRPFVTIPDILVSYKLMRSLNPEVVIPGHGAVTTTRIFDEYEAFYTLLQNRVSELARQGKSLEDIKTELKMPEYADWAGQDRLGVNIDVAYKTAEKK
jgi:cyclase